MAEREIRSWHSPALGREMRIARWGHYGKPVVYFPTGGGDFLDVERFLMVRALEPLLAAGRIKLYAPESVCRETWASRDAAPPFKSKMQARYDRYLIDEALPFIRNDCGGTTQKFATAGASIGAYNALTAATKHPEWFDRMIGMSGTYVMDRRMNGHFDDDYRYNSPVHFLPELEGEPLRHLQDSLFVLALGQNYENPTYTQRVSSVLTAKAVPHRVEVWGSDSGHDWPTWRTMLPLFLSKLI